MLASHRPASGVLIAGMLCEWFTSGIGCAYSVRQTQCCFTQLRSNDGLKRESEGRNFSSSASGESWKYSWPAGR